MAVELDFKRHSPNTPPSSQKNPDGEPGGGSGKASGKKHDDDDSGRQVLSKRSYTLWIAITHYGFAVVVLIVLIVAARTSFSISQEQLTAFASAAGVFAGLALAIGPLSRAPNNETQKSFFLLSLTFALATVLILLAKLTIGAESDVNLYFFSLCAVLLLAATTPGVSARLRRYEFYVEFLMAAVLVYPLNLLTAGLMLFVLGSLQLLGLISLAFLAPIPQSIPLRQQQDERIMERVQSFVEERKAWTTTEQQILHHLARENLLPSPSSLQGMLERMDEESIAGKPRLIRVSSEVVIPMWRPEYWNRVLESLPEKLIPSDGRDHDYYQQVASACGLSATLLRYYVSIEDIMKEYYRNIQGEELVLLVPYQALCRALRRMPLPRFSQDEDVSKWIAILESNTADLKPLKDDRYVVQEVLKDESETLTRFSDSCREFITQNLDARSLVAHLSAEDYPQRKGSYRLAMLSQVNALIEENLRKIRVESHLSQRVLERLAESAGERLVDDLISSNSGTDATNPTK